MEFAVNRPLGLMTPTILDRRCSIVAYLWIALGAVVGASAPIFSKQLRGQVFSIELSLRHATYQHQRQPSFGIFSGFDR